MRGSVKLCIRFRFMAKNMGFRNPHQICLNIGGTIKLSWRDNNIMQMVLSVSSFSLDSYESFGASSSWPRCRSW